MSAAGRPREFNEEEILDRGIDFFRTRGFEAASMDDLIAATGINRQSLYNLYTNKKGFFNACVKRYRRVWGKKIFSKIFQENAEYTDLKKNIRELNDFLTSDRNKTCLLLRSTLELSDDSFDVMSEMAQHTENLIKSISDILARAEKVGKIKSGVDTEKIAAMIVSIIFGMIVMAKSGRKKKELDDIAANIWETMEK